MEESEWISLMVVQNKKTDDIKICVELQKLNDTYKHDPFPTPFMDETMENVGGQETYSFTDGFLGYHQVQITEEDWNKNTFVIEWGYFQYTMTQFGLKTAPTIFPIIVVVAFKEFMRKFLEAYLDDWTMFSLLKKY